MSTKRQPPPSDPEKNKRQRIIDDDDDNDVSDDESDTLSELSPSPSPSSSSDNLPESIKKPIAVTSVENLTISELFQKLAEYEETDSNILDYQQLSATRRRDVFKALSDKCCQKENELERWKEIARKLHRILKSAKQAFEVISPLSPLLG